MQRWCDPIKAQPFNATMCLERCNCTLRLYCALQYANKISPKPQNTIKSLMIGISPPVADWAECAFYFYRQWVLNCRPPARVHANCNACFDFHSCSPHNCVPSPHRNVTEMPYTHAPLLHFQPVQMCAHAFNYNSTTPPGTATNFRKCCTRKRHAPRTTL